MLGSEGDVECSWQRVLLRVAFIEDPSHQYHPLAAPCISVRRLRSTCTKAHWFSQPDISDSAKSARRRGFIRNRRLLQAADWQARQVLSHDPRVVYYSHALGSRPVVHLHLVYDFSSEWYELPFFSMSSAVMPAAFEMDPARTLCSSGKKRLSISSRLRFDVSG